MDLNSILIDLTQSQASDIFIVAGRSLSYKKNGKLYSYSSESLTAVQTEDLLNQIYQLSNRKMDSFLNSGDDDFAFALSGYARFRVNTFKQRGSLSAVIRIICFDIPNPATLGIPENIMNTSHFTKGLVLVTGPAGSGKSTTLSCIIDRINETCSKHIITLEEPIEYLHRHKKSIVTQREIPLDSESYVIALRAALRQSPDVILLGEMRDYETIQVAMTAAETGHLVFSTLHTLGSANTIDRIIDVFPASQQRQIAVQLAMTLQAIISQELVPSVDDKLVPAFEFMTMNTAIRNMIRDNKVHQIDGLIYSSTQSELQSFDSSLLRLAQQNIISKETACIYATNPDMLSRRLH